MHAQQQPCMANLHASMLPCDYVAESSPRPSGLHAWKRVTLQRRQQGHMLILWKLEQVGEHMIASERTYTELRGAAEAAVGAQYSRHVSCAAVVGCRIAACKRAGADGCPERGTCACSHLPDGRGSATH